MRILITADTLGGVWDYTCTLARGFHAEGHRVMVAAVGDDPRRALSLPEGIEVEMRSFRLEWMDGCETDVAAARGWLSALAGRWGADVVHLDQYAHASAGFAAPTVVVAHSDVRSWFSETLGMEAPPEWGAYTTRVREGLRAATTVVAPTIYQARLLAHHYGRRADRVIYNGVAVPADRPGGSAAGEPLVLLAGRAWDLAKGAHVLDAAIGLLGREAPPAHLLGSTTSPRGERFEPRHLATIGELTRPLVDAWFGRAAIYAGASLYEPFGLAPLEAALHGCALVLSDIGSFRELWDGCALFFPPGDAAALAESIQLLVLDTERRAALAAAARDLAQRSYTDVRMVDDYLGLYRDLRSRPALHPAAAARSA